MKRKAIVVTMFSIILASTSTLAIAQTSGGSQTNSGEVSSSATTSGNTNSASSSGGSSSTANQTNSATSDVRLWQRNSRNGGGGMQRNEGTVSSEADASGNRNQATSQGRRSRATANQSNRANSRVWLRQENMQGGQSDGGRKNRH